MLMTRWPLAPFALIVTLAACAQTANVPIPDDRGAPTVQPVPRPEPAVQTAQGNTAEALDTASAADVAEATNVSAPATGLLGETVAALGDPSKPGFWLMTPLVSSERTGRVEREGGAVVQVTLIPLGGEAGAGSQLSLSAMRALGFQLTDLAPLKVYGQ